MKTVNISKAKQNFSRLLEEVLDTSSPILIKRNDGKGCYLVSENIYNSMLETLLIQSDSKTFSKIKNGEKENISRLTSYYPNEEW